MEEDQFLGFGGCGASPQLAQEFGRVIGTEQMVEKSSKKNTPGGRASKNGVVVVANNQLNKECSQLPGKEILTKKTAREAMNTPRGNPQHTQESGKAVLIKQRVGGPMKNSAPGGRTLKNMAAKMAKKHSIKSKAGGSQTKSGGNVAKKHFRKGGMKVCSVKAEKEGGKVAFKPGKTERKDEGGSCAVKREKKSRGSKSGLSPGFLAKQELVRKGKRENVNKYSSPTTIGKKRKGTSPGDLILNCVPTSPGKPFHGRTWLPVGEGEVQVSTLQILKIHLNR